MVATEQPGAETESGQSWHGPIKKDDWASQRFQRTSRSTDDTVVKEA